MKTTTSMILIILLLAVAGCGGSDDTTTPPPPPSDAQVLSDSWTALGQGDTTGAESGFRTLLSRGALVPQAYDGLGWTFTTSAVADSALANFRRAAAAGADTTSVKDEARGGQCFAENAGGFNAEAVSAGSLVSSGWVFAMDSTVSYYDVVLTMASSHYLLGQFVDSLETLNLVDPAFSVDVETVDGRAALAARIEQLLNS